MDKSKRRKISDEEAKKMLNEILTEDELNNEDGNEDDVDDDDETNESAPCAGECAIEDTIVEKKFCECIRMAENASRFSLRVMEAMRRLQHEEGPMNPTSSPEDIVDYIQANYRDDGDLYAQVRTALKQVCSQGFVMKLLENEYHLVGPDAIAMNQVTCSNERKDCSLSSPIERPDRKSDKEEEDACDCDTQSKDETAQRRKGRKRSIRHSRNMSRAHRDKRANDNVAEEASVWSYGVNLTDDDDDDDDDDCGCGNKIQRNVADALTERRPRGPRNIGDTRVRGGRQTRNARTDIARRKSKQEKRGTTRFVDTDLVKSSKEDEALSQTVDDIYRELEEQNPGKLNENEKELKQWIKRCQEECKRRKRRRDTDN